MKKLITLLALSLLTASCTSNATIENGDIETLFHKERTLTISAQKHISEPLPRGNMVDIIDNRAIIQIHDPAADFNFYIVDIESGEVVNKIFSIGRGRNEMMYPTYLGNSDGRIYFFESVNTLLFSIAITDLDSRSLELNPQRIKAINTTDRYCNQHFMALSQNRFIAYKSVEDLDNPHLMMAPLEDGQLYAGEIFDTFGQEQEENKYHSYNGVFTTTDDGKNMLFRTRTGVYLRFYDCSDVTAPPTIIKEYIAHVPKMKVENHGSYSTTNAVPETIMGFNGISADNDNYYLNFIKLTHAEYQELRSQKEEYSASHILVFSKKGEPIEKLIIEESSLYATFHYSSIDHSLYQLDYDEDGNDCLVQYKL